MKIICLIIGFGLQPLLVFSQTTEELVQKANTSYQQEDYLGAAYYYGKAIEKNANSAEVFYMRGQSRIQFGDVRGAIADYNKAIDLNPLYADAFYNRGLAKRKLKDYGGALSDISYSFVTRGMQKIVSAKN